MSDCKAENWKKYKREKEERLEFLVFYRGLIDLFY
jgi:hypothetical protein